MTNAELNLVRSSGQFSQLAMHVYYPPTVYTARVSNYYSAYGVPVSGSPTAAGPNGPYDLITNLTVSSGSGTVANVLNGMTLWVGSTAGAYDLGRTRVRSFDGSTLITGET
jgi:hypothetical protein